MSKYEIRLKIKYVVLKFMSETANYYRFNHWEAIKDYRIRIKIVKINLASM